MSLVTSATTADTEEKQLAASSDDKPVMAATTENATPATFELADQHFGLSVDLLKKNELNDAIDNAYEAVAIGEEACEDVNDIRLAKYFIQHGKCLLAKIQQTRELLGLLLYLVIATCTTSNSLFFSCFDFWFYFARHVIYNWMEF